MAIVPSLPVLACISLLLLFSLAPAKVRVLACESTDPLKTWCVAKPSTKEEDLQNNIQFACSKIDCGLIQRGGPCFDPQTSISHASVVMNLYYQSAGRHSWNCYFGGSGLIVLTYPTMGVIRFSEYIISGMESCSSNVAAGSAKVIEVSDCFLLFDLV
ncbi:Glucan endo-1,3-beta-D-glucosidase [Platanthera guangdongensis]|uniref:Glucan endo-1,3-beta-D-glucosidase n=1 Tax=Platanthera guangdongensis TaxID=2320717 RepID=A0ABR2MEG5_9ASPA